MKLEKNKNGLYEDPAGNEYKTTGDLAKAYGLKRQTLEFRVRKRNMSLEEALSVPLLTNQNFDDGLGNIFKTLKEALDFHHMTLGCYQGRKERGMSNKEIFTTSKKDYSQIDPNGVEYSSQRKMCKEYGIDEDVYSYRINAGWTKEDALKKPVQGHQIYIGLNGEEYTSKNKLCQAYHISPKKYREADHDLKKVIKNKEKYEQRNQITFKGNTYNSKSDYGRKHGVDIKRVKNWQNAHPELSFEEAVKYVETHPVDRAKFYNGKTYANTATLAREYGINPSTLCARLNKGIEIDSAVHYKKKISIGETKILEVLDKLDAKYLYDKTIVEISREKEFCEQLKGFIFSVQKTCKKEDLDLITKTLRLMRPDFALLNNNKICYLIEYDGEQHFKINTIWFNCLGDFLERHNRDVLKEKFSEVANIPLLRIRYDQLNEIEFMINDLLENPNKYLTQHNTFLTEEEYWEPFKKNKDSLALSF